MVHLHSRIISKFLASFSPFYFSVALLLLPIGKRLVTGWAWPIPLQMAAAVLGILSPIHLPKESLPLVVRLDAIVVEVLALMVSTPSKTTWIIQMMAAWITSRQVKSRECMHHTICTEVLTLTRAMKATRTNLRRTRSLPPSPAPRPAPHPAIHQSLLLLEPATLLELLAAAAKRTTIAAARNVRRTRRPS